MGGGNAALCAAIDAAKAGAQVLIPEAAAKGYRGGNSRHTRNFRAMHDGPLPVLTGTCGAEECFDNPVLVSHDNTDEHLARIAICGRQDRQGSQPWMQAHGVRCPPSGTLSLRGTTAFFLDPVLAFLVLMPVSEPVHGFCRLAALVRDARLQ